MDFTIKLMETEPEIEGKGYVHWRSWQDTYTGLIDQQYLDNIMTLKKCVKIAHNCPDNTIVAKDGEKVIGFACYGPYRDDSLPETGELYAIYILKECYGTGAGQALMNSVLDRLDKYSRIAVWVLKGNERAIRFYQKCGFQFDGAKQTITLGSENMEYRMVLTR